MSNTDPDTAPKAAPTWQALAIAAADAAERAAPFTATIFVREAASKPGPAGLKGYESLERLWGEIGAGLAVLTPLWVTMGGSLLGERVEALRVASESTHKALMAAIAAYRSEIA